MFNRHFLHFFKQDDYAGLDRHLNEHDREAVHAFISKDPGTINCLTTNCQRVIHRHYEEVFKKYAFEHDKFEFFTLQQMVHLDTETNHSTAVTRAHKSFYETFRRHDIEIRNLTKEHLKECVERKFYFPLSCRLSCLPLSHPNSHVTEITCPSCNKFTTHLIVTYNQGIHCPHAACVPRNQSIQTFNFPIAACVSCGKVVDTLENKCFTCLRQENPSYSENQRLFGGQIPTPEEETFKTFQMKVLTADIFKHTVLNDCNATVERLNHLASLCSKE